MVLSHGGFFLSVLVSSLSCPCLISTLSLSHLCLVHCPSLFHLCLISVLSLSHPCLISVLSCWLVMMVNIAADPETCWDYEELRHVETSSELSATEFLLFKRIYLVSFKQFIKLFKRKNFQHSNRMWSTKLPADQLTSFLCLISLFVLFVYELSESWESWVSLSSV